MQSKEENNLVFVQRKMEESTGLRGLFLEESEDSKRKWKK